ncbi:uncharacterized protein ACNS7B_012629 [Menidia menidia]
MRCVVLLSRLSVVELTLLLIKSDTDQRHLDRHSRQCCGDTPVVDTEGAQRCRQLRRLCERRNSLSTRTRLDPTGVTTGPSAAASRRENLLFQQRSGLLEVRQRLLVLYYHNGFM